MNGKQAKRLRKAATGLAVTLTQAGKDIKKDGYEVRVHNNVLSAAQRISKYDPKGVMSAYEDTVEAQPSRQFIVRKDSLKSIYKTLKSGKA